eukprot:TRINITY_DN9507_c0_g1_i6.p1 TRINITY_DN9507_c0_g1~~TRINITY_DN9507_c0_g1_i6.p1  ORF type:complete len:735 (-),score=102.26 TRINITY_DN9507_c0_g1_i6:288-2408(-)
MATSESGAIVLEDAGIAQFRVPELMLNWATVSDAAAVSSRSGGYGGEAALPVAPTGPVDRPAASNGPPALLQDEAEEAAENMDPSTFRCSLCKADKALLGSFPLGGCACLLCRTCLADFSRAAIAKAIEPGDISNVEVIDSEVVALGSSSEEEREGAANAGQHPLLAFLPKCRLPLQSLPCPGCRVADGLERADVLELCGDALRAAEDKTLVLEKEALLYGLTTCPACGTAVELQAPVADADLPDGLRPTGIPEFDRTVPRHLAERGVDGQPMSRAALVHRERHRFRCTCKATFCNSCRAMPYHLGFNCKDWAAFEARPECTFCDNKSTSWNKLLDPCGGAAALSRLDEVVSRLALKEMRRHLGSLQVAAVEFCVDRREVEGLVKLASICDVPFCKERLRQCCLRPSACGHFCMGCQGEEVCPPCLQCGESGGALSSTSTVGAAGAAALSCPGCSETVPPGPAVRLTCGHVMHKACLERQLGVATDPSTTWQPPLPCSNEPLSFDFRRCPLCRTRIEDLAWPRSIAVALRRASELELDVRSRAAKRLKSDPSHRRDDALLPGGAFDGRPKEYALTLYSYHMCEECMQPYFGGERRCEALGAPAAAAGERENSKRLCGGCAARKAGQCCPKGHDPSFIEWKCQYCCSTAVWFCWGTTHLCDTCHEPATRYARPCPGAPRCPLAGKHPANGSKAFDATTGKLQTLSAH